MVRILALAAAASIALTGAALASCPLNQANSVGSATPLVEAAVYRDSSCISPTFCWWRSQWNNTLGTAHVTATGPGCVSEIPSVNTDIQKTSDDFVISGPAGAVSFQVFLQVVLAASSFAASMQASLTDGIQTASLGYTAGAATRTLQLTLSRDVGTHFHLDRMVRVDAACTSTGDLNSALTIVLPPGYSLTSCYGYTVSSPVPTLPASWGKVKTLYR